MVRFRRSIATVRVSCNLCRQCRTTRRTDASRDDMRVRATTWNLAAINNNPFEYYSSSVAPPSTASSTRGGSDDDGNGGNVTYDGFMIGVEKRLVGDAESPSMASVMTEKMLDDLEGRVGAMDGVSVELARRCREYYAKRVDGKTCAEFLRDVELGAKRLCSMPDRVTNTVFGEIVGGGKGESGGRVCRPTVSNCYEGTFRDEMEWWAAWMVRFFDVRVRSVDGTEATMAERLVPIKRAKYPAISEEEESLGVGLQVFFLAGFDAALICVATLAAGSFEAWQRIRAQVVDDLVKHKQSRTLDILDECLLGGKVEDDEVVVCCLQEVGASFVDSARRRKGISAAFEVCCPAEMDAKRDQNSVILVSKSLVGNSSPVVEVTKEILDSLGQAKLSFACGDFCAFLVGSQSETDTNSSRTSGKFLLCSFHGDTDGLQTKTITSAVNTYVASHADLTVCVFGMDANTHVAHKDGKKQGVADFIDFVSESTSFRCCWSMCGVDVEKDAFTTFSARTFLQAQLNKAVPMAEATSSPLTDRHPKDHILISTPSLEPFDARVERINAVEFRDGEAPKPLAFDPASMFPNARFPSDHAAVTCRFTL